MGERRVKADEYFQKGVEARDSGRFKTAKTWFVKAAALSEKKPRAGCWFMAADCDEELGDLSGALRCLRKAERCSPRGARIQCFLGQIQRDLGRLKLAERAFRKSIARKPSAITYIFLGNVLGRQDCDTEAKACFRAALRLEPDNEEAHYNLGICYRYEGRMSAAEKHLRRAIEIDNKYAVAYAELGSVLLKKDRHREARKLLRRAIRLDGDQYWARLYLAVANWQLRRLKEAEEQYREAVRIDPSDAPACSLLGDFLSVEQRGDAEPYLAKAISLDPKCALAHYEMGKHLYNTDRDSEAKPYLKKAARMGHKRAKELLAKLLSGGE